MAIAALAMAACALPGCTGSDRQPTSAASEHEDIAIMGWPDLLDRPRPQADTMLAYGEDPLQVIDVWTPEGPGPHPAVIMIHGGCWQTDIAERDIMNYIAADLRESGIGVWNIEYRGVDRDGGGYPGTYLDVGRAADMFVERGEAYGLDTRRTVAIGHSAGGHLALWLAMRPALAEGEALRGEHPVPIQTVISQGGLPDLRAGEGRNGHACGTDAPRQMAGGKYALTSPPEMPTSDTRQILFNNALDRIAPPQFATEYRDAMAKRGVTVETHVDDGAGHVELIAPDSESWAHQKAAIRKALGLPVE